MKLNFGFGSFGYRTSRSYCTNGRCSCYVLTVSVESRVTLSHDKSQPSDLPARIWKFLSVECLRGNVCHFIRVPATSMMTMESVSENDNAAALLKTAPVDTSTEVINETEMKEASAENGGEVDESMTNTTDASVKSDAPSMSDNEKEAVETTTELTVTPDSPVPIKTTLLGGLSRSTSSIRDILCAAPDTVEIADDIDEAQRAFLDMFSTDDKEIEEEEDGTLDEIAADSDLSNPDRRIWVVTTAALPWRTGTAVNPLLRALYLTRGRPKHRVTLVIPWLDDVKSRIKLYGAENSFALGGQKEQEAWIRRYCRERAHCPEEEQNLNILFYSAIYQKSFGSIFPAVDICSLIPENEADVAILDEPEHLNWFRAPPPDKEQKKQVVEELKAEGDDRNESETKDDSIATQIKREKADYGWAFKFRWVVGILHTNYSAYMDQYAIGTAIIAARAIGMLSSVVVRAYCHQVIRLSAVLPTLAPHKEVTCNVHGVRSEFLQPAMPERLVTTVTEDDTDDEEETCAPIYFIGKVMWAKGFDKVLEIQDHYRTANGHYFPIDIYGAGPDEKAIKRAFFGRSGKLEKKKPSGHSIEPSLSEEDVQAAEIFAAEESLREQVAPAQVETAIEVVPDATSPMGESVHVEESPDCSLQGLESADTSISEEENGEQNGVPDEDQSSNPLSIIGDLSTNSVATAKATSQAVYSLVDSIVKGGMKMTLSWEKAKSDEAPYADGEEKKSESKSKSRFFIDPPKTTYEWRKTPIPAQFLGVRDHAELRDIPEYKVFLNASVTEVLCTTTAEALAMGKFAVIPKHCKYNIFLSFFAVKLSSFPSSHFTLTFSIQ